MKLQSKEYRHYRMAALFCLAMGLVISAFVALYGRQPSFLLINSFYAPGADYFFTWFTYFGDGIVWVPVFLYVLVYKRDYFILLLSAVLISTLITHFFKRVVYADELRPLRALPYLARAVPLMQGKDAYTNSFPSGHTATAFTLAQLLPFVIHKRWAAILFPLIAFLVGYSRVYLSQHFVTDVLGGIGAGVIASYLSMLIYLYFKKKVKPQSGRAS